MTQPSTRRINFKGRSFPVFTLEPEAPLDGWIEGLDALLAQSPGFFAKKSIVVDFAKLEPEKPQIADFVAKLSARAIRVMGISGVDPAWASDELPPILSGSRSAPETEKAKPAQAETLETANSLSEQGEAGVETEPPPPSVAPLTIVEPVRSGQSIRHPHGDVTVLGSVASGAEIMAGGSVHIYGTLRGRVMAGAYGEKRARVFCRRMEAELISVCGVYLMADEIDENMQSQSIQAWLEDETVRIARLD